MWTEGVLLVLTHCQIIITGVSWLKLTSILGHRQAIPMPRMHREHNGHEMHRNATSLFDAAFFVVIWFTHVLGGQFLGTLISYKPHFVTSHDLMVETWVSCRISFTLTSEHILGKHFPIFWRHGRRLRCFPGGGACLRATLFGNREPKGALLWTVELLDSYEFIIMFVS
jgi:hypothetical protein